MDECGHRVIHLLFVSGPVVPQNSSASYLLLYDHVCMCTGLLQPQCERVAVEALQLCTLLLPPASRRKLQLLMRMMSRISQNVDMPRLHPAIGTRTLVRHKTDVTSFPRELTNNIHLSPCNSFLPGEQWHIIFTFHFFQLCFYFPLFFCFFSDWFECLSLFTCLLSVFCVSPSRWFTRFQPVSWAALWSVIWTSC